jgi:hypothetical protein
VASKNVTSVQLVTEALEFIRANALNREAIDWGLFKTELTEANVGTTLEAAHAAIRQMITRLDDGHSFLLTPE